MKLTIEVYNYPGKKLSVEKLDQLVDELWAVAELCFEEVPTYQVLSRARKDLARAIITVARDENGVVRGFCSALVLSLNENEKFFHTGLTCIDPLARGKKLTHKLTSKGLLHFILRESLFKPVWVTNCACVLSSIGNVAKHFEAVYPSPFFTEVATNKHHQIAEKISNDYRSQIAINENSFFNKEKFVFEGSVLNTSFQKDKKDERFFHRDESITNFYQSLLNFERGDEVLQVGKISLSSFPKYLLVRFFQKKVKALGEKLKYANN